MNTLDDLYQAVVLDNPLTVRSLANSRSSMASSRPDVIAAFINENGVIHNPCGHEPINAIDAHLYNIWPVPIRW